MRAVAGFLLFNLPPARIFLGDAGSTLLGLVVGVLAVESSLRAPGTAALVPALCLLTIPIFDTTAAILRRKLTGRGIANTDRGHLHHCLLHRGYSRWRVLLLVSALCLLTVAGAAASLALGSDVPALLAAVAVVGTLVGTRLFGHAELKLLRQRLRGFALSLLSRPGVGTDRAVEVQLQGSADWAAFWCRLTACAGELGLRRLRLDLNAPLIQEGYHACWERPGGAPEGGYWHAQIPLLALGRMVGRLDMAGRREAGCVGAKIVAVSKLIQELEVAISEQVSRSARKATATASERAVTGNGRAQVARQPALAARKGA
jgi:UDP-GlcNAc:undecaprenyl-phosphate GlcNAc-1-phosphate transferase